MFLRREDLEAREKQFLAAYACPSSDSHGREHAEAQHPYRTAFQRDRDRVLHTTAFRRLQYKTQVFVYHEGDHYRTRLTHTLEVAQLGRTLARALGANEDLAEAICLAHDLGHPAFGHTGEATLNTLMTDHGGFDHQRQTMRIVSRLETRYAEFPGLNLSYEVREGLVKHDTDYDVTDAIGYEPELAGSLECQLANLADEIAYNAADLEDGLRSGLLELDAVRNLEIWRLVTSSLGVEANARVDDLLRTRAIRRLIELEITDALADTERRLAAIHATSPDHVRAAPEPVARFSSALFAMNIQLKSFLMEHFYRHPRVMRMAGKAHRVLSEVFQAYRQDLRQLPLDVQARIKTGEESADRTAAESADRIVCDYLAGMTDRYAILEYKKLFDPEARV